MLISALFPILILKAYQYGFRFFFYEIKCLDDLRARAHIDTIKLVKDGLDISCEDATALFQSYLFNLAYNYDIVMVIPTNEKTRVARQRTQRGGRLFPYKNYKPELLKYYTQGLSSDSPFTQYLAYYHVAEFFFQSISEQDVYMEIENYITDPSFSPYNKKCIKDFYKNIKKKIQTQKDDDVWDEKNGFLLCLKQYVDVDKLKQSLSILSPNSINYYQTTKVPFADDGNTVDFNLSEDKIHKQLRDRVYSVRNAIVHSKEGEKLRYEPYKHDKDLTKEIPLIRAIAEQIIISTASPLKLT